MQQPLRCHGYVPMACQEEPFHGVALLASGTAHSASCAGSHVGVAGALAA
jgi:hypothetical protein